MRLKDVIDMSRVGTYSLVDLHILTLFKVLPLCISFVWAGHPVSQNRRSGANQTSLLFWSAKLYLLGLPPVDMGESPFLQHSNNNGVVLLYAEKKDLGSACPG
jgi:hypothetical protein